VIRLNRIRLDPSASMLLLGCLAICLISLISLTSLISAAAENGLQKKKTADKKKAPGITSLAAKPLPLEQARQRARLLHDIYESTLLTMHRHYFEPNKKQVIPSRALEDVFYTARRRWGVEARWLAVSAQAMNIDHKPKTPFEKKAVQLLARGNKRHEEVREGTYRVAAPIVLFANCIRCHTTRRRNPVAGLVLSLPVKSE